MPAKLWTPAEVAAKLRVTPRSVRRIAERHNIGTQVGSRMRFYTDREVTTLETLSTGKSGRPAATRNILIRDTTSGDVFVGRFRGDELVAISDSLHYLEWGDEDGNVLPDFDPANIETENEPVEFAYAVVR
jgi:hypothetical protein